jgi:hypothetical protein
MWRFWGAPPPGAQPCPARRGGTFRKKNGRSGWPAVGLWGCQQGQMGPKVDRLGLRGTARSRQDESKEVGEVGGVETGVFEGQGGTTRLVGRADFSVVERHSVSARIDASTTRCQHELVSAVSTNWRWHALVSALRATRCQLRLAPAPLGVSTNWCQHLAVSEIFGVRTTRCQQELVSAPLGVSTNWCQHTSWCQHELVPALRFFSKN